MPDCAILNCRSTGRVVMLNNYHISRVAVALGLVAFAFIASVRADVQQISVSEADEMLRRGVAVLDVRRADEWRTTGIVPGSRMITAFDADGLLEPDFLDKVAASVPGDQPVILICRSGNRSGKAARLLTAQLGFQHVYNVEGGIQQWLQERLPVTPCPAC